MGLCVKYPVLFGERLCKSCQISTQTARLDAFFEPGRDLYNAIQYRSAYREPLCDPIASSHCPRGKGTFFFVFSSRIRCSARLVVPRAVVLQCVNIDEGIVKLFFEKMAQQNKRKAVGCSDCSARVVVNLPVFYSLFFGRFTHQISRSRAVFTDARALGLCFSYF